MTDKNEDKRTLPERRRPASGVLVASDTPTIVFVTVCARQRRCWMNQPCVQDLLESTWRAADHWLVGYYLLMPDHLHLFCAPRNPERGLDAWVTYWKRTFSRVAAQPQWEWQTGKWDTRLRRGESYHDKWEYVRQNPVRKELVQSADDWPYSGVLNELRW